MEAVKLHEDGYSYRAIGRKLKVGTQSVANWVHANKDNCEDS
jgi:transposase